MKNEELVSVFMNCFIDYVRDRTHENNQAKNLRDNLITLSKQEEACRDYSGISEFIYKLSNEDFKLLKVFFDLDEKNEGYYNGAIEQLTKLMDKEKTTVHYENLKHFERHVKLSCHQRDYISNNITRVSKDIENITSKVDEARGKVSGIYSEFVGILGVFTALSFALMGSVQVFGNILKNVNNPTIGNIGYVLVVGGLYLILIYLITMTLFIAMKKVFNNDSKYKFDERFTKIIILASASLTLVGVLFVCTHVWLKV